MNAHARRFDTDQVAALQAENDTLREEVAFLRSELGIGKDLALISRLRRNLHVRAQIARLLSALYARRGQPLSHSQLLEHIAAKDRDYSFNLVTVTVSEARRRLGPETIVTVRTDGPGGYALSLAGMAKVRAAMEDPAP